MEFLSQVKQKKLKILEEKGHEVSCFVRDYPQYTDFLQMMKDVKLKSVMRY